MSIPPLKVVTAQRTASGFSAPLRGWNSSGLQANPATSPAFTFDQQGVLRQAKVLRNIYTSRLRDTNDYYVTLGAGWSVGGHGDEHGRIMYDAGKFDIPALAQDLEHMALKLGVCVLPGAFCRDGDKTVYGTSMPISATLRSGNENGVARCDFDFDRDGVQQWHDATVAQFASWGVDMIQLDCSTPASPSNGGNLPPDNFGDVIAYRKAIAASGISWANNADSMRIGPDISNSGENTFIAWSAVQRAIESYRDFISRIVNASDEPATTIYPDMGNLFTGNEALMTGVSDAMRQTMATHWIGAAANLLVGSDMTRLDDPGLALLLGRNAEQVARFTAQYPMQPRNPGTGRTDAKQLQAWIAGPDTAATAVVVLANYGPDRGHGGFKTEFEGKQDVKVTWAELGISGCFAVQNVWTGVDVGFLEGELSATLDVGESRFFRLTRNRTEYWGM